MKKRILELFCIVSFVILLASIAAVICIIIFNIINVSPELIKEYRSQDIVKNNWLLNFFIAWIRASVHGLIFNKISNYVLTISCSIMVISAMCHKKLNKYLPY